MISSADFLALQKLLQERCGMALTSDKLYLVGSRLGPVAQRLGFRSVIELMADLRVKPRESVITAVIEAMVTHESLFFRDGKPFEQLGRIVAPELMRARQMKKCLRIWSAACSSGQEAYSIAMQLAEDQAHAAGWRWDIVGTDISDPILVKARAGVFSAFEIKRGLTDARINRHFTPTPDGAFQANENLRRMATFRLHNLLDSGAILGSFDVVFCRNVLIYFDSPTKAKALENIAKQMAPDGVLFLGSADSVMGLTDKFIAAPGERGLYRLAGAQLAKSA